MTTQGLDPAMTTDLVPSAEESSPDRLALRRFLRNPAAMIGAAALLLTVLASILAPVISPYPPTAIDLAGVRQPPSGAHLLGTDSTGRDVFSRLLAGGQVSLMVGFSAALTAVAFGTLVGVLAGSAGSWTGSSAESSTSCCPCRQSS